MSDSFPFIARKPPRGDAILRFIVHYGLLLVLALARRWKTAAGPAFLRVGNLFIILQSVSIVALLALGVTLSMSVGGLDLSIGAVAAMSVMCASYVMVVLDWGPLPAIFISLACGALVGLFNGFLIVRMGIPDILATLGSMFLIIGVQLIPTGGRSIAVGMTLPDGDEASGSFSAGFLALGRARLWDTVPVPVLIMAVMALLVWGFLELTRFGRVFYAIGGNERAARLAGAPVEKYKLMAKGHGSNANFFRFEDKAGAEQVSLHAERNLDTDIEIDESHTVGGNRSIKVEGMHSETIKLETSIAVQEGSYFVTVDKGEVKIKSATSI